jgi:hypothetical protein
MANPKKNAAAHAHAAMVPNELFEQVELDGAFSGGIDIFDHSVIFLVSFPMPPKFYSKPDGFAFD